MFLSVGKLIQEIHTVSLLKSESQVIKLEREMLTVAKVIVGQTSKQDYKF